IASGTSCPHVPAPDFSQSLDLCFDDLSHTLVEKLDGEQQPFASPVCEFGLGRLRSFASTSPPTIVSLQKGPINRPGDEEGDRLVCNHLDTPADYPFLISTWPGPRSHPVKTAG